MHSLGGRIALALILLAALALRLANLTLQPLWFDEGWSVWFATTDLATMAARTAVDIHPPFYYALLHFWIGAAGSGEFALRMLSVCVGVVSVAMLYRFGTSIAGRRVGLLAASVGALSPLQVYYAQEIRMYGLVTLLGLVSSWLFWTAVMEDEHGTGPTSHGVPHPVSFGPSGEAASPVRRWTSVLHRTPAKHRGVAVVVDPKGRWAGRGGRAPGHAPGQVGGDLRSPADRRAIRWLLYVVMTGAAMYTEYYAAFIPLFHFLFLVLRARFETARRPAEDPSPSTPPRARFETTRRPAEDPSPSTPPRARFETARRPAALYAFGSFALVLAGFAPWLLYAGPKLVDYVGNKIGIEQYATVPLSDYLVRHLVAFSVGHLDEGNVWLGWASVIFSVLAIVGLISLWRGRGNVETQNIASLQKDNGKALFLLLYLLVPVAAAYLVQMRFPFAPPRMERLLLLASPPFLALVAAGIAALRPTRETTARRLRGLLPSLPAMAAVTTVLLVCAASLAGYFTVLRYPEQDYRALADRINALALPGDVVVCVHPWQVGFLQAYLAVPVSIQQVADPAWGDADRAMLDGVLDGGHRIWLPAYQSLGRILENAMEGYLLQRALAIDARWYQETRLSFYAPTPTGVPAAFAPFSTGAAVGQDYTLFDQRLSLGRAVLAGESQAGWSAVPLIMRWRLSAPLAPLSYSLRLYDKSGRLWAAQERQPLLGNVPMEGWTLNSDYIDRTGFLVPAGVPPGSYALRFVLYRAADGAQVGPEATVAQLPVVRPALAPRASALTIQTPLSADWPGQRLLGYTLQERTWLPGDAMHVDLFWQASEGPRGAAGSFVQVQDAQGQVVAQDASPSNYPPGAWQRGELVREQRDLTLPANLAPGVYVVATGLVEPDGTTRVRSLERSDTLDLRKVVVKARAHQLTPPTPRIPADVRFGDLGRIVGFDFEPRPLTVTVRLYWQVLKETDTSYKVFVHLNAPGSAAPAAQHDSPPANGLLPTTTWVTGEYITDEHVIDMTGVTPDSYNIFVGLYDPQSGLRVPAFTPDRIEFRDDAAPLGLIRWK